MIYIGAAGGLALAVNLVLTPIIIRIARRHGWYDLPNGRKIHTSPIPRLGGVGMFISLAAAVALLPALQPVGWRVAPILGGLLLVHLVGLADDFANLSAALKFVLQLVAAGLATLGGVLIDRLGLPGLGSVALGWWAYPLTMLWIAGFSNALNFVDGVDGFAGSIAAVAALAFGALAVLEGRPVAAFMAAGLLGAVAGFLVYNFPPGRIFMGDSGSLLLGFALGVLPLVDGGGADAGIGRTGDLLGAVTILALPVLDTAAAITRRVRDGLPVYSPDKKHLHHKLLALGLGDRALAAIALVVGLLLGGVALLAKRLDGWAVVVLPAASGAILAAAYAVVRRAVRRKSASASA